MKGLGVLRRPAGGGLTGLSHGELDGSVGFLLRLAQLTAFERLFALEAERGEDLDLSLAERSILLMLAANDAPRQGELADALHLRWPLMTKLVRGLESRGLVAREVPPNDRRSVTLRLTPEAETLVARMQPRLAELDRDSLDMIDAAERAQLIHLLRKVAGLAPLPCAGGAKRGAPEKRRAPAKPAGGQPAQREEPT